MRRPSAATVLVVLVLGGVLAAPSLLPPGAAAMDPARALLPPSAGAPFGTDVLGRDYLARVLAAGRPGLLIAAGTTLLAALVGIPLGVLAGAAGGRTDLVVMRVLEVGFAVPPLVLAIAVLGVTGPSAAALVLALAASYAPLLARVARAATLARMGELYVLAARAAGERPWRIVALHVLPNTAGTLVTQTALVFSYALLAEASLSFLGLGTQPANPSWGRLLTEAIPLTTVAPWLGIFPGAALVLVVVAVNLRADAWGDALDPRLARGGRP
ncbi:ABC transporter permease [Rubellimicrobium sp. CFH 75288]|uniref:ABC transporter permease n=1 Tax=Rubellimicrobium sp. CFH 75288 TaxID=2697034 RepID=UPI00141227B0|nr:ABC transporter permease subunit [Rubellimicrobium sp. CFH 75288]